MKQFSGNLREIDYRDFNKSKTKRYLRSSVTLPSQYHSYSVCVEFMKQWFLEKFNDKYFNSVYVDGKHSFDEFNKFSTIDEKLKRKNPLLAVIPTINMENNRNWIDSCAELPMMLRRTRMEGTFFNDTTSATHLQIVFKTILMNYTFKMRVNTRAEELDLYEFIKVKHRAGWSETKDLSLDIHVPKEIIAQIAWDNGFEVGENLNVKNPIALLKYLNQHSYIPFLYKLRCANGNKEFFIKVPNCVAYIKSEMPSMDDGERQGITSTNYTIDFNVEVEMTAPFAYTYFSQKEQKYINTNTINADGMINVMQSIRTTVPDQDEHKWDLYTTTDYVVDDIDLGTQIEIDFKDFFEGTDMQRVLDYTKDEYINPAVFINFKFFNDGVEQDYEIDWINLKCKIIKPIENITTIIGIYCNMEYINDALSNIKQIGNSRIN